MADKSVGELIAAQSVTPTDLFVLEQNGTAKKLTGQVLENWLVSFADGHGGIHSIEKLSTNVLEDTYRITLADTTTFDFVVTNGRSITGISKTGTSGLVDTYTISYNNGTTSEFTVTNGAKGDKGDNAYVWIKYSSQEPTESSHSIGDIPDDWIGIYYGNASTAPTDWKQYKWFKHKGEKGDTGNPATLATKSVTYQVGDSGIIIPSGSWGSSIPVVSQGKYLWTKTEVRFNTGDPIVSYSVARMGIDGTGAVSSVAGVSPDATGNVQLTPDDIGADTKKKYGKLVVFGDSVGEGANNDNYSYVDMLRESGLFSSVVNACVGGAGIGSYDGTGGYDLMSQIERYSSDVADADIILLEYGGNDVSAVMDGNVQMGTVYDDKTATTVCSCVQKALERIYELNPSAKIHWVNVMPTDWDYVNMIGGDDFADNTMLFMATALRKCAVAGMYIIQAPFMAYQYISSDNVHPNTDGHKYITALILNGLFGNNYVFPNERVVTLGGSINDPSTLTSNAKHKNLKKLIDAGVPTRLITGFDFDGSKTLLEYHLSSCNDYQVGFGSTSYNGVDLFPVFQEIKIIHDDTVQLQSYNIGSV